MTLVSLRISSTSRSTAFKVVVKLSENLKDKALVEDVSNLLLEQAMLVEGAEIKKPADFVKRLNRIMEKAL